MQLVQESPDYVLDAALAACKAGAWTDALRLAGSLLAQDPMFTSAFDVISTARRALESARTSGADCRQMTILFADVAGSTALLGQLGGETYRDLVLQVHEAASKAVSSFGGRIAQYLGDGILAYFSYPLAHEDDAQRAIYAGIELLDRLAGAAPDLAARFGRAPTLRLGIDTGRVVVGAAGAGQWTTVDSVFGDPPHVAARLQALAPPNSIIISDATRQLVARQFVLENMGLRELAGYPQPSPVYRVLEAADERELSGQKMIDRDPERATLEKLWSSVREGRREELLMSGEAGVGKTQLVEYLANVAVATGGRVIGLYCSAAFQHSAFHPVSSALRRFLGRGLHSDLTESSLHGALLQLGLSEPLVVRSLGALARVLNLRVVDELPQQLRAALFDVLLAMFECLALAGPLLVFVEDLHAADASTSELFAMLRARITAPLLLVATARRQPPLSAPWLNTLQVEPLTPAYARALVSSSAPALDDTRIERVVNSAGGLPLLLIDAARGAASGASLLPGPSATTALVTHRLHRLGEDERTLLYELAVLGTACAYPLLAAVSELPTERLERALARLMHDELLVAENSSTGSAFYFRHPLYQEVALDSQLASARQRRHSRCADALLAEHSLLETLPELVAEHLLQAGRAAESIEWRQRAGDRAAASAAHLEAMEQYERALGALPERTPSTAALELGLLLSYGASCSSVYGYSDARCIQAYSRASEIGDAAEDAITLLPALWGMWSYYVVRGSHERARELASRCVALADSTQVLELRAVAAAISGTQYVYMGRWQEALEALRLAVHAAGPAAQAFPQDPALASRALLAIVEWMLGDEVAAERELELALQGAAALSGRQAEFTRAYVYCFAAWYAQLIEAPQRALQYAGQGLAIAQRHQFVTWLGAAALHIAGAQCELGDFAAGLALFENAIAQWQLAGARLMLPYFFGRYGSGLVRAGRAQEGIEKLRAGLEIAPVGGEAFYDAELHRLYAEALTVCGEPSQNILRECDLAISIANQQHALAFERRALQSRDM